MAEEALSDQHPSQTMSDMGTPDLSPVTRAEKILDKLFWAALAIAMIVYFAQFSVSIPFTDFQLWSSWDPAGSGYSSAHVSASGLVVAMWFIKKQKMTIPI